MLPTTRDRVEQATSGRINRRIHASTAQNIERFRLASLEQLEARLEQLEREWDIERTLEANAAAIGLAGTALAAFVHRRWLALPALVSGFLLQHALQGWCPPVPVFRRLGVRTSAEIEAERRALEAFRRGKGPAPRQHTEAPLPDSN